MSIEVGEHLPIQYESIFMENLVRHAKIGIIMTWCEPIEDGIGLGHFNERPLHYII